MGQSQNCNRDATVWTHRAAFLFPTDLLLKATERRKKERALIETERQSRCVSLCSKFHREPEGCSRRNISTHHAEAGGSWGCIKHREIVLILQRRFKISVYPNKNKSNIILCYLPLQIIWVLCDWIFNRGHWDLVCIEKRNSKIQKKNIYLSRIIVPVTLGYPQTTVCIGTISLEETSPN